MGKSEVEAKTTQVRRCTNWHGLDIESSLFRPKTWLMTFLGKLSKRAWSDLLMY